MDLEASQIANKAHVGAQPPIDAALVDDWTAGGEAHVDPVLAVVASVEDVEVGAVQGVRQAVEEAAALVVVWNHLDSVALDERLVELGALLELARVGAAAGVGVDLDEAHGDGDDVGVGRLIELNRRLVRPKKLCRSRRE